MGCNSSHIATQPVQQPATINKPAPVVPPKTADNRIALTVHHNRSSSGILPPTHTATQLYGTRSQRTDNTIKRSSTGIHLINVVPSTTSIRLHTGTVRPVTGLATDAERTQLQSRRNVTLLSDASIDVLKSNAQTDENIQHIDTTNGGFNYCDPLVFTGRMQDTFQYYSKNTDYINKSGLTVLATDCCNYTYNTVKEQIKRKNKSWNTEKLNKEFINIIHKYLPGHTYTDTIEIIELYLKSELKLHDGQISRDQFFLSFTRIHHNLFTCNNITVEREQLIERLEKQYANRQKQYIESMKHGPKHTHKEISVTSQRARRSSNRRQSQRESGNMFDMNDSLLQSPSSIMVPVNEEDDRKGGRRKSRRSSKRSTDE